MVPLSANGSYRVNVNSRVVVGGLAHVATGPRAKLVIAHDEVAGAGRGATSQLVLVVGGPILHSRIAGIGLAACCS
jgi:hypothetical protein